MAERLASALARQYAIADFYASSAGTRAMATHPIHHHSASVLRSLGADASEFAARQLTAKIASDADLILTMTKIHRDAVLGLAPRLLRRTFTLGEAAVLATEYDARNSTDLVALRPQLAAAQAPDIPDPIGQNLDTFLSVGTQIADLLEPIIPVCR